MNKRTRDTTSGWQYHECGGPDSYPIGCAFCRDSGTFLDVVNEDNRYNPILSVTIVHTNEHKGKTHEKLQRDAVVAKNGTGETNVDLALQATAEITRADEAIAVNSSYKFANAALESFNDSVNDRFLKLNKPKTKSASSMSEGIMSEDYAK